MSCLIVNSLLCGLPSDSLAVRGVLMAADSLQMDSVAEIEREDRDRFWKQHRTDGLFDYIRELVVPEDTSKESGWTSGTSTRPPSQWSGCTSVMQS